MQNVSYLRKVNKTNGKRKAESGKLLAFSEIREISEFNDAPTPKFIRFPMPLCRRYDF